MSLSLRKLPVVVAELLVCLDCHSTHHSAEAPADADREPWALWTGPEQVMMADASTDDEAGFSWRACDGCGSTLGGDRFPYVLLSD